MNFKRFHESKNLFDADTIYGIYKQSDGAFQAERRQFYAIKATPFTTDDIGKTFTFATNISPVSGNVRVSANIGGTVVSGESATRSSITFTVESANDTLYLNYGSGGDIITTLSEIMLNEGSTPQPYEPYSSEVWHDIPYYQHKTATDTLTLPAVIYPTNTYLNVELKGNSVQNGTPSPSSPIDVNGVGDESDVPTYIVNAHIDGVNIQKAFEHSELCELTAPNKPSEYFNYWKDENNNILSYNRTFTQRIAMDRNIYATYSNVEVTPQPCLEMYLYNAIKDGGNNLYWLFFGEVPDNYSVVEEGIMYTANRTAGYTQDSTVDLTTVPGFDFDAVWADSSKYRVDKYTETGNIFTQVFNLFIGDSVNNYFYGKGYITIKNNTTQEQSTIYSDMVKGTYNNTNLRPTPTTHYNIPITCSNITYNRYLSETESIRYIKKLVLDGTESWNEGTSNYYIYIDVSGRGESIPNSTALSTHTESGVVVNNNGTALFFNKSVFVHSSLADFKTYLQQQYSAGTPVTVWYVLAEPETSIINEPLMKIGNYTDKITTTIPTKGTTEITVDTTLQPSNISVDGFQDIEIGLKGNTVQSGTPTPDNPIIPQGTGERTANLFTGNFAQFDNIGGTGTTYSYFKLDTDACLTVVAKSTGGVPENRYLGLTKNGGNANDGYRWVLKPGDTFSAGQIVTIKTSQDGYYFVSMYQKSSSVLGWIQANFDIMLNSGSTALPYEPYGYKIPISCGGTTTPVYLGEVETTRRIRKYEFTGQENWELHPTQANLFRLLNFDGYLFELKNILVCNTYKSVVNGGAADFGDKQTGFYFSSGAVSRILYIRDSSYSTASDFKTYLQQQYAAGTPVTIWYVLAAETTGIVNEPLMKIGDYADTLSNVSIPVIAGGDTISVDTTVHPSETTVNYKGWHPVQSVHERENGAWI